jgi:hypothetical protein
MGLFKGYKQRHLQREDARRQEWQRRGWIPEAACQETAFQYLMRVMDALEAHVDEVLADKLSK